MVIIGAGLAGAKASEALREQGYAGRITLLGAEPHRPYERPPLSKGYLQGTAEFESAYVHTPDWYREHDIDLRSGARAVELDREGREVILESGDRIGYDKLLLATGASSRQLPGAEGALYLRTVEDSDALRASFAPGKTLVIVGGGWIGLEVAAAARQADVNVTVVEPLKLPLLKALGSEVARVFADLHRERGVDLRLETKVAGVDAHSVRLEDGGVLEADTVLIGIGAVPNVELARSAGLAVGDGVEVDSGLRTSDPDIFAVGDIAGHDHPRLGRIRVEHWANALNQPAVAAANMLGGDAVYDRLPYFFSDQYDLGMEYTGHSAGSDRVVFRGDVIKREFVAFWLTGGRVVAAMNANIWDAGDDIKELIGSGRVVDPARLGDPTVPLAQV